jgi:two-component system cell cycle sensor histidine kinase/response regulator CckA
MPPIRPQQHGHASSSDLLSTDEWTSRTAPSIRKGVGIATVVSLALMAAFELLKEGAIYVLGVQMSRTESHVWTVIFSGAFTSIAAVLVLRRQRRLSEAVLAESSERERLFDAKRRLEQRKVELEASHRDLAAEISERRRIEAELRQSEAINQAVFTAMPDLLFRVGRDGFYRAAHVPKTFIPGIAAAEWVGQHVSERLPAGVAVPMLERIRECLDTGMPQLLEHSLPTPTGTRTYEVRYVRCGTDEVLGLVRDITERVRLERELGHAHKMESVGRLAGGVAHDFNNLLTTIVTHTDFAAENLPVEHEAHGDLTGIRHAAGLGAQLTRRLLAFARKQPVRVQPVDLAVLVRELAVVLRRTVGAAINVHTVVPADPCVVMADPGQLEQVLLNLAVNARDAMASGGSLTVKVSRDGPSANGRVLLSVSDTGVGMDATTRERAFEPFFTTKGEGSGTGLGLSIVYGIVTRAGGSIEVDSRPGEGTRFEIAIPEASDVTAEHGESHVVPAGGNETVLVAEDDPTVRSLAVRALRRYGYAVLSAMDGVQALDVASSHAGPIHLFVTDVLMPRMGGPEAAERLKRARPGTPVLFISGYTAGHDFDTVDARMVAKPFTVEELALAVRSALDASRVAA